MFSSHGEFRENPGKKRMLSVTANYRDSLLVEKDQSDGPG